MAHIIEHDAPFYIKGVIHADLQPEIDFGISKTCLGNIKNLPDIASSTEIDDIVITDDNIEKELLISILDYCFGQGLNIWVSPNILPIVNLKMDTDNLCGFAMVRLCKQKREWMFNWIKHGLDALVALPIFILILPIIVLVSLIIKLNSKGPVFYVSDRVGKNGIFFKMFKFRTMHVKASCDIHKDFVTKLIKGEITTKNNTCKVLKIVDDPRITTFGKILRRFSLDELPQLINVLKGEMSLVGPRPCTTYEFENYRPWHKKRTHVRPGITGVWQVNGRSEVDFEDMIIMDLYYVYNRSLKLDFRILCQTLGVVLNGKGAY